MAAKTTSPSQVRKEREEEELASMSLVEHLEELRWRILKSLIAIVIGAIVAFTFRQQVMDFLQTPLPAEASAMSKLTGHKLVTNGLTEGLTVQLVLSAVVGCVLALPVILYQTWAFISPGLYKYEKKNAIPFIFIGMVLFTAGVSLGYVMLRFPVQWLIDFQSSSFTQLVTAGSYFQFVAIFMLVFGLIFELPLVLTFLARIGLISADTLKKKRAITHIGMWIAATFMTPGADIYSPIIIGAVLSVLYELTIIFIKIFVKPDPEADIV
jgi:sec-independent protein translocase protein TatC